MAIDPRLIPYTAVTKPRTGGDSYEYLFWGSALTEVFGKDYTGHEIGLHVDYAEDGGLRTGYGDVFKATAPKYLVTQFQNRFDAIGVQICLRLPFGEDGIADHVSSTALFSGRDAATPWNDHQVLEILADHLH